MKGRSAAMLLSALQLRVAASFSPYSRTSVAFLRPYITRKIYGTNFFATNSAGDESQPEPMANIYMEWKIDDDRVLSENSHKSIPELSALLGRGLRGVESRLSKLADVNSAAYARLFIGGSQGEDEEKKKLIPAKEVLRRIQYDYYLSISDFSVAYYDRVDDTTVEAPMDAPNTSIKGNAELFVLALPEHRISSIKYKERVVWDKENRLDRVFGSMNGNGETIQDVMKSYETWKEEKRIAEEWNRKRQKEISSDIQNILGEDRFNILKDTSSKLLEDCNDDGLNSKKDAEAYVEAALALFKEAHNDDTIAPPSLSDLDCLDIFSQLVAFLPQSTLRPAILIEIALQMKQLRGGGGGSPKKSSKTGRVLPELIESDLIETFVRGSGSGGQKMNKTSSKVVLLHEPTQLRVDCQDTRSLQQNRKIARKRLRTKLDELLNGKQSISSQKNSKKSTKKAKSKTRNKARLKKKKEAKKE